MKVCDFCTINSGYTIPRRRTSVIGPQRVRFSVQNHSTVTAEGTFSVWGEALQQHKRSDKDNKNVSHASPGPRIHVTHHTWERAGSDPECALQRTTYTVFFFSFHPSPYIQTLTHTHSIDFSGEQEGSQLPRSWL